MVERNWRIEALGFQKISFHFDLFISEISLPLSLCFSTSIIPLVFLPNGPAIVELYINTSKWWAPCQLCSLSMRFVSEWISSNDDPMVVIWSYMKWSHGILFAQRVPCENSALLLTFGERERACTWGVGSCFIDWFEYDNDIWHEN